MTPTNIHAWLHRKTLTDFKEVEGWQQAQHKGITIESEAIPQAYRSLSDVNGKLKSTQAQLKDVNNLLKLDPSTLYWWPRSRSC